MTPKFACPYCGDYASKVTNTRPTLKEDGVDRRRECLACHRRYSTRETVVAPVEEPPTYKM